MLRLPRLPRRGIQLVLDIKRPSRPREIASWTGEGAPPGAPPVNIWSVVPDRGLLFASDRNFGLYVLKHDRDDDDDD
jgi:hypothetical protein